VRSREGLGCIDAHWAVRAAHTFPTLPAYLSLPALTSSLTPPARCCYGTAIELFSKLQDSIFFFSSPEVRDAAYLPLENVRLWVCCMTFSFLPFAGKLFI
jgi:hypothetical protein